MQLSLKWVSYLHLESGQQIHNHKTKLAQSHFQSGSQTSWFNNKANSCHITHTDTFTIKMCTQLKSQLTFVCTSRITVPCELTGTDCHGVISQHGSTKLFAWQHWPNTSQQKPEYRHGCSLETALTPLFYKHLLLASVDQHSQSQGTKIRIIHCNDILLLLKQTFL